MSPPGPLVIAERIGKTYGDGPRRVQALSDLTLHIDRGETVSVSGPSGSGKSTLLHLFGCLDSPSGGRYIFDGLDVSTLRDRDRSILRSRKIGFVFQTFHLVPQLNVLENVLLPFQFRGGIDSDARRRAREALDRVGLSGRLTHRPGELSGGEMQRVAIARAMAGDPLLLLADEPTGNLDSKSSALILDLLLALNARGTTLILVTHDPGVAARCRRHVQLYDGRLVSDEVVS